MDQPKRLVGLLADIEDTTHDSELDNGPIVLVSSVSLTGVGGDHTVNLHTGIKEPRIPDTSDKVSHIGLLIVVPGTVGVNLDADHISP